MKRYSVLTHYLSTTNVVDVLRKDERVSVCLASDVAALERDYKRAVELLNGLIPLPDDWHTCDTDVADGLCSACAQEKQISDFLTEPTPDDARETCTWRLVGDFEWKTDCGMMMIALHPPKNGCVCGRPAVDEITEGYAP